MSSKKVPTRFSKKFRGAIFHEIDLVDATGSQYGCNVVQKSPSVEELAMTLKKFQVALLGARYGN